METVGTSAGVVRVVILKVEVLLLFISSSAPAEAGRRLAAG